MRIEYFAHGDRRLEIHLPRSSEELIDEDAFAEDERLPYWAELWPAARALSRVLLDLPELPSRAIELGCGVGLPSLALSGRGVDALATDYYQEALDFTLRNAAQNAIPAPRTMLFDWRRPPVDLGPFDLVVGADLLYEMRNVDALVPLFSRLLTATGVALIADPDRVHLQPFVDRMTEGGWFVERLPDSYEAAPAGNGMQTKIRMLRISRPVGSPAGQASADPLLRMPHPRPGNRATRVAGKAEVGSDRRKRTKTDGDEGASAPIPASE